MAEHHQIDRSEIERRLQLIGDALRLPNSEVQAAAANDEALIEFAERHNQSLEWIVRGNFGVMICALKDSAFRLCVDRKLEWDD